MVLALRTQSPAASGSLHINGSSVASGILSFEAVRPRGLRIGADVGRVLREITSGVNRVVGDLPKVPAAWLTRCEQEVEELDDEAAEEGIAAPTAVAKINAKALLQDLAQMDLPEPLISVTEWQQVAIYFQKGNAAVLIHCGPDKEAAVYASIGDRKRRAKTDDASDLPDDFLRSRLLELVASG